MNILLSPDSFKGTLTSLEVCDIIESALRNRIPDCNVIKLPAADGGKGNIVYILHTLHLLTEPAPLGPPGGWS